MKTLGPDTAEQLILASNPHLWRVCAGLADLLRPFPSILSCDVLCSSKETVAADPSSKLAEGVRKLQESQQGLHS